MQHSVHTCHHASMPSTYDGGASLASSAACQANAAPGPIDSRFINTPARDAQGLLAMNAAADCTCTYTQKCRQAAAGSGHQAEGSVSKHTMRSEEPGLPVLQQPASNVTQKRAWHSGSSAPLNSSMTGLEGKASGAATRLLASSIITPTLEASSPAPARVWDIAVGVACRHASVTSWCACLHYRQASASQIRIWTRAAGCCPHSSNPAVPTAAALLRRAVTW